MGEPRLVKKYDGETLRYPYLCEYICEGRRFDFTIWATSFEDAEAHLRELKATAKVLGQVET